MLIGYMQAKQGDEDGLLAQRQALQDAGCEQLVEDLASGGRRARGFTSGYTTAGR